jgi:hypothetical protein
MTAAQIIICSAIAAVVAWRLAWTRARTAITHIRNQAEAELSQRTAELMRWRARAGQLTKEVEAWKAGHLAGRTDVISIVPLLTAARDKVTCTCGAATQADSRM